MAQGSGIAWTHHTFSPWWGCQKVSPACANCYAERDSGRFHPDLKLWGEGSERKMNRERYWLEPYKWNERALKAGTRERVFSMSMGDLFEDRPELEAPRKRLFSLVESTSALDWLLLTKRPENFRKMIPASWKKLTPRNAWFGITAETQSYLESRIGYLTEIQSPVRFISAEPLLGELLIRKYAPLIDWVITGDESGPGARKTESRWHIQVMEDCREYGISYFMKQICEDGKPIPFSHIPKELQVREMPKVEWKWLK